MSDNCNCAATTVPTSMSIPDLIITIAYFSIPLQLVVAVCRYPHLGKKAASASVIILVILFALFIFMCGAGHLLRCLNQADTALFHVLNIITAVVSLVTAIYLIPFAPLLLASVDRILKTRAQSKAIVEEVYPEPTMRQRILDSKNAGHTTGVGPMNIMTINNNSSIQQSLQSVSVREGDGTTAAASAENSAAGKHDSTLGDEEKCELNTALPRTTNRRVSFSSTGMGSRKSSDMLSSLGARSLSDDDSSLDEDENKKGGGRNNIRAIQNFLLGGRRLSRRRSNENGGAYSGGKNQIGGPDFDVRNNPTGPIAMQFEECSIMFADIVGFTSWSAKSRPDQVFTLLEHVFWEFDQSAREMDVFKLSTIGDCYLATCGVPIPRSNHAVVLTVFAERCRTRMNDAKDRLESEHGLEGVRDLTMRFGIHSGPITAGVLRGEKSRFELFGDTINTASRMESTGVPNRIQVSSDTAELLKKAGQEDLITPREERIHAKGKGEMQTYLVKPNLPDDDAAVMGSALSACPTSNNDGDLMQSLTGFDVIELNDLPKQLQCKETIDLEKFHASLRSIESNGSGSRLNTQQQMEMDEEIGQMIENGDIV